MNSRKVRSTLVPVIYGVCVVVFLVSMYFAGTLANKYLFNKSDDLEYVDGEITESIDKNIPVVSTDTFIIRPYLDSNVSIAKTFYDYKAESEEQEKSIVLYEGTYMQNSGVDYACDNVFDVVSILDGTVISVSENDILGTTVEVRHSNDLISVYQSLSEVVVKQDDTITQGQIIAKSGLSNINNDMGNHLHFELYHKGAIVNPEEYYNKNINEL